MEKNRFGELSRLNEEALKLQAEIEKNIKELFGEG